MLPDDPFFSMRSPGGYRQILTYAVMHLAVKAAAMRLGVDPSKFCLHSLRIGGGGGLCVAGGRGAVVDDIVHGKVEVSAGLLILSSGGYS